MLRFPNPGSTIENFVRVYAAAFERLNGHIITLDDFVSAVVAANLATSSGHMGEEAVARSTREDRSRDPLYNQLKMYAELFRALGWLHPTERSSLNYTFSLLGHQVVAAGDNYLPLFCQCVLGIVYPTRILEVKGDFNVRPFAFLLKVMAKTDGCISRDEMIVGPLNMSDRDSASLSNAVDLITRLRAGKQKTQDALEKLSGERRIQINTLHNYTRWPIAVLRDCGWATKDKARYRDGRSFDVLRLTEQGRAAAEWVNAAHDVRMDQAESLPMPERTALSIEAHYALLGRCNFDLSPVLSKLESQRTAAIAARKKLGFSPDGDLLFSPFQTLRISDIAQIFPPSTPPTPFNREAREDVQRLAVGRGSRDHLFVAPIFVPSATKQGGDSTEKLRKQLADLIKRHGSVKAAASAFALSHAADTKTEFYPLISHLFQVLKYRSEYSRAGVNYQRWDAYVEVDTAAIPIEIKSPTEEEVLSTKAVRQALENKIVLLSRGGLETKPKLTSLIVGYKIPNERGDMSMLIDDIYGAYGLSIGVIDLTTLAALACHAVNKDVTISSEQLSTLRGFLDV